MHLLISLDSNEEYIEDSGIIMCSRFLLRTYLIRIDDEYFT